MRLLHHFVAVGEELHYTRAANRLFVAQEALSRDIRGLEERVGLPLLDRTTRRVTLTPVGEQLLVRARELLALHDEMLRELQDHLTDTTPSWADVRNAFTATTAWCWSDEFSRSS